MMQSKSEEQRFVMQLSVQTRAEIELLNLKRHAIHAFRRGVLWAACGFMLSRLYFYKSQNNRVVCTIR